MAPPIVLGMFQEGHGRVLGSHKGGPPPSGVATIDSVDFLLRMNLNIDITEKHVGGSVGNNIVVGTLDLNRNAFLCSKGSFRAVLRSIAPPCSCEPGVTSGSSLSL